MRPRNQTRNTRVRVSRPLAGVECWWAEPTDLVRRSLRRHSDRACEESPWGTCSARRKVPGEFRAERSSAGAPYVRGDWDVPKGRRWPDKCQFCGRRMPRGSSQYADTDLLYRRHDPIRDRDELVTMTGPHGEGGLGPPGMLTDAPWTRAFDPTNVGADGISLCAVTPGGYLWQVDSPATGGGRWTRTGDPREPSTLSVSPSIKVGEADPHYGYHGFLTNGRFTTDIGS